LHANFYTARKWEPVALAGEDPEGVHQLRIGCKKLRYAAEFFAPLYGEAIKNFIRHLKALQDLLGTLHDTAVMPGLQKELLKGKKSRSLKHHAQRLLNKRGKQAKEIEKALKTVWADFYNAECPWMEGTTLTGTGASEYAELHHRSIPQPKPDFRAT